MHTPRTLPVERRPRPTSARFALLLGAGATMLAACSGGGSSEEFETPNGGASTFAVVSCTLGCSNGLSGTQVSCGTVDVFVNQEIAVLFSRSVDLDTVDKNTFQVVEVSTGGSPTGAFTLDPTTPSRLIFRPSLTFDTQGNPVFGLKAGSSYNVRIPGAATDPPPYVRSVDGKPNQTRVACTVAASLGVDDPVAGAPTVEVFVDVVTATDAQGNPTQFALNQPADGAVDVFRMSPIRFLFDDLMNAATLVNPVTGQSDFLSVWVDADGNVQDPSDQLSIEGTYDLDLDEANFETTVVFTPTSGYPSAGSAPEKRKIVVRIPSVVSDLGGNPLQNAGEVVFTPELLSFPQAMLPPGGEQFTDATNRDARRTGALWTNAGFLGPGFGGAGYLGDLVVGGAQALTLCTGDCASFPGAQTVIQNIGVLPLGPDVVVPGQVPMIEVTDGIFPFASVNVAPGALLELAGSGPGRLLARGEAVYAGVLDASGDAPVGQVAVGGHRSNLPSGEPGAGGGPAGGRGGDGGDRPDNTGTNLLTLPPGVNGISNPGAVVDGGAGEGVGGVPGGPGRGRGGPHWPTALPTSTSMFGGLETNNFFSCFTDQVGGAGGGGGYATDGGLGLAIPALLPGVPAPSLPPNTPGGSSAEVGIDSVVMELDPEAGNLRGGSGGGGGGASIHTTQTNGQAFNCGMPQIPQPQLLITAYRSHSAAGGGGGGGAVQLVAGRIAVLDGIIDCTGGAGSGSLGLLVPGQTSVFGSAAPGGGGSGGAVLVQALDLQIGGGTGRIDVSGGPGGDGVGNSLGGNGGAGLVRLESLAAPSAAVEAPKITPFDPLDPTSSAFLSVGQLDVPTAGPNALSGGQSCWMKPPGNFFVVEFVEDDALAGVFGWDMDVVLNFPGLDPIPFRAPSGLPSSVEQLVGTDLLGPNAAPVVVRFQGVRALGNVEDFCDVDFDGIDAEVVPESLTGWVRHPAELNDYWDSLGPEEATRRKPNMVRFQVVFDPNTGLVPGVIQGVTNLRILAQPD